MFATGLIIFCLAWAYVHQTRNISKGASIVALIGAIFMFSKIFYWCFKYLP